ncbi:flagellar assembly protein FliH [Sulfurivermis fontis]|uniref:flagellar assembly protein FliH n=1 Tax=Sulfurivermis fontis TaxID=1972068 RepID=UPI000FD84BC0|nr:flagellar assembly protein FliH [Sulfurivermis fontis]
MSSSKVISADSLTAYERWELPEVDGPGVRRARVEDMDASAVKPLTAEQLEQIRHEAQREGFETGRREGLAAAQKEVRAMVQRLTQIINAFSNPLEDVDAKVEQELVSLAIAVARQIIRRELKTDPGQVVAVVREALAALPAAARRVTIHLHPEDAALVRETLPSAGEESNWRIVEDARLSRGGCRIHAEHSQIDATVEKRIAAIVTQLLGGERATDKTTEDEHDAAQ